MFVNHLKRAVVFVWAVSVTSLTLGQYPRDPMVMTKVRIAPPSIPQGGADLMYGAYRSGNQYCVEPKIVVRPAKGNQSWPRWSRAFVLELVDGSSALVRPDTRVDIPEVIAGDGAASRPPQGGPVVLPKLAQWCVGSAQQPTWYVRIDGERQRVEFPRPARSQIQ